MGRLAGHLTGRAASIAVASPCSDLSKSGRLLAATRTLKKKWERAPLGYVCINQGIESRVEGVEGQG
jgi:hypothetical protein